MTRPMYQSLTRSFPSAFLESKLVFLAYSLCRQHCVLSLLTCLPGNSESLSPWRDASMAVKGSVVFGKKTASVVTIISV